MAVNLAARKTKKIEPNIMGITAHRAIGSTPVQRDRQPRHPEIKDCKFHIHYEQRFLAYKACWPGDEIVLFDGVDLPLIEIEFLKQRDIQVRKTQN